MLGRGGSIYIGIKTFPANRCDRGAHKFVIGISQFLDIPWVIISDLECQKIGCLQATIQYLCVRNCDNCITLSEELRTTLSDKTICMTEWSQALPTDSFLQ